ncbi:TrbI F-type domain-containing protein [Qipengyuania sp. DY56-A-20]|uniref:TrbI F-type domain-containing protein n=1 Tax=Qipengyuania benthica TaxID=3067651 RepID=A0ABT9HAG9_9SPHN|nr:TrbI F-type domain-containing protein [Qipengyuania sp. DY56-A-20]MDP4540307.1 TrbI F-type domain-containing protein [Qipengyuania sp. DY56-A-20]
MTETRRLHSFNRPLLLKIIGMLALVAALLWAAWVSRELTEPHQQIVTVRLAETIAGFVDAEARGQQDPEASQARVLAFLQASERAVAEMGTNGRVVLVGEAVLAGDAPDATDELRARIARQLEQGGRQ